MFSLVPEENLPITFLEGTTSRVTPVPTLYAIRLFCRALESALDTLLQSDELQEIFSERKDVLEVPGLSGIFSSPTNSFFPVGNQVIIYDN